MRFNQFQKEFTVLPIMLAMITTYLLVISLFIIFSEPVTITKKNDQLKIPVGATLWDIAEILETKEIINNKSYFVLLAKIKFSQKKLRSGYYDISQIKNSNQLINLLKTGQNLSTRVTIPEGSTIHDIADLITQKISIDKTRFLALTTDAGFIQTTGLDVQNLEGYLFPDTYFFYKNEQEKSIIIKMVSNFHQKWRRLTQNIPIKAGKSQHELLTLASLIEGECILDDERPIVSSLYQNRLRRGIKLEADPTIQYIIPDGPRRLLTKDLKIDSPYNTYMYKGLPPGPVNNPGEKSILAALRPADTNFIYMVAQGDGSHYFTRYYNSFLQAKRKLQRIRRKLEETN